MRYVANCWLSVTKPVVLLSAVLLIALCGCNSERKQQSEKINFQIDRTFVREALRVHVKLERDKIGIADTLWIRLEAMIDEGYEVAMPAAAMFTADQNTWGILDYKTPPDRLLKDNRLLVQREYRLEPLLTGKCTIPALQFLYWKKKPQQTNTNHGATAVSGQNNKHELFTEEIPIEILGLPDEQRKDLTIAKIKDVTALPGHLPGWWIWSAAGAVVVLTVLVLIIILRKRKIEKHSQTPKAAHEIAYEKLRRLAQDDPVAAGRIGEFYERINSILRWYIEHRFSLKAPERTTEEFIGEVQTSDVLSNEQKETLRHFMEHCDLVKFALYGPTETEIQKTFDLTGAFIEETKIEDIVITTEFSR